MEAERPELGVSRRSRFCNARTRGRFYQLEAKRLAAKCFIATAQLELWGRPAANKQTVAANNSGSWSDEEDLRHTRQPPQKDKACCYWR